MRGNSSLFSMPPWKLHNLFDGTKYCEYRKSKGYDTKECKQLQKDLPVTFSSGQQFLIIHIFIWELKPYSLPLNSHNSWFISSLNNLHVYLLWPDNYLQHKVTTELIGISTSSLQNEAETIKTTQNSLVPRNLKRNNVTYLILDLFCFTIHESQEHVSR